MEALESYERNGCRVELHYDDSGACNPHDWDGAPRFAFFHSRYNLANDVELNTDAFSGWKELAAHLIVEEGWTILVPVYMHDHSGVSLHAGGDWHAHAELERPGWDSGCIGFAGVTDAMLEEWGCTLPLSAEDRAGQVKGLQDEVSQYSAYLNGEVYGYIVTDPDGEEVDSCWGFVGDVNRDYALTEANSSADYAGAEWAKRQTTSYKATMLLRAMGAVA